MGRSVGGTEGSGGGREFSAVTGWCNWCNCAAALPPDTFREANPVHVHATMLDSTIEGSRVGGGGRTALRELPSAGEKAAGAKAEAVESATRRSALILNIFLHAIPTLRSSPCTRHRRRPPPPASRKPECQGPAGLQHPAEDSENSPALRPPCQNSVTRTSVPTLPYQFLSPSTVLAICDHLQPNPPYLFACMTV